jgi:hypothetical protein
MIDNNDTDLNARTSSPNSALDQKIDELISGLYWDAKCGRAATEYNLKKAGMIEMISGHVAGQMRDGDNFWDDCRWTSTERGRCTSMADLQRIILSDPPLDIAVWDAEDEAADVAGGCGGGPGDPILANHQRILAHLEKRAERIHAAEKGGEGR